MAGLAAFPTVRLVWLRMPLSSFSMLSLSSSLLSSSSLFLMMEVASDSLSACFLSALCLLAVFFQLVSRWIQKGVGGGQQIGWNVSIEEGQPMCYHPQVFVRTYVMLLADG